MIEIFCESLAMLKKELLIFITLFFILALGMHFHQWTSQPLEHIRHLSTHKIPYHPLLYTGLAYIGLGIFRLFFTAIKAIFAR